ncbi:MAG: YihY/virulence factor BrkB family protein [Chloroflexi bacterium]|nr:YihY/virulence factor BrkB family protein [Chloroflexota bacterium]
MLGFAFGDDASAARLAALLRDVYPSATDRETRIVHDLVEGRAISLGLGALGTVLGATAIFGALGSALGVVLGRGARTIVGRYAAALRFIGSLGLLAALSFAVSYGAAAAQDLLRALGVVDAALAAILVVAPLLGLAAGFVFFLLIYTEVPSPRVAFADARVAALVSAVLWEVAKLGFGVYTRALGAFSVYGPLALAAGLLTWIWVTAMIVLLGAEFAKARRAAR